MRPTYEYSLKDYNFPMVSHLNHGKWIYVQSNLRGVTPTGYADLVTYCGDHFCETLTGMQAANDGSLDDLADVAAGLWPRSLMADSVHPNSAGYAVLGSIILEKLASLGYLS